MKALFFFTLILLIHNALTLTEKKSNLKVDLKSLKNRLLSNKLDSSLEESSKNKFPAIPTYYNPNLSDDVWESVRNFFSGW